MKTMPVTSSKSLACMVCLGCSLSLAVGVAQESAEPRVARVQMQLKSGEDLVDVIEQGDLLTVVGEQVLAYEVLTYQGRRGLVNKVNAVKLADSVDIYDQLIKARPKEGRLYTQRATACWAKGDQKQALADFDRAIGLGYREPHAYTSRGMFHAAVGNVDAALDDFRLAIGADPKDEVPYINRAAVLLARDRFAEAIKDYDAAIRLSPKKASNYQQRAVAHKMNRDAKAALADFNKALELDPKHVPALMGRGYIWFEQDKHKQAIADFSAVIELAPQSAAAYNNRGFNRQLLGDRKNALLDYNKALELAPDYALCLQNKAWLLSTSPDPALRNGEIAVKSALKACEINKYKDPGDLRALAASYAENGKFDLAIGWQEKVVALSPDSDKQEEEKVLEQYKNKEPYRDT